MYIVILAGGSGTRFWPLSRRKTPKQLMSLFGDRSMLQRTIERVLPLKPKRIMVVTNAAQADETTAQLACFKPLHVDVLEEPVGRNTAPAIGLAAAIIASHDPTGVMVVLPADHYITGDELFRQTLVRGVAAAAEGNLVTLGIRPSRPETGYGYIEVASGLSTGASAPVIRFVEKPPLHKAISYLESGNFFWNSGMFIWRTDVILDQILAHMPDLSRQLARITFSADYWEPEDLQPQINEIYADIRGDSIDFGVMEKADNVVVIPADFGWSDVGSWTALPEVMVPDAAGNVIVGAAGQVNVDAERCLVRSDGRLVALVGVKDLVVVATGDSILVCARERAQEVKKVVEELERRGMDEYL